MNFADAIRRVSQVPSTALTQQEPGVEQPQSEGVVTQVQQFPNGESLVRLEFRLTPEQTQSLLHSALGSTHSYLTLREAAKYLRLSVARLTDLAERNTVPAFQIEGTWRFERKALDLWANEQMNSSTENQERSA